MKSFLSITFLFFTLTIFSQEKIEKEYRLQLENVPKTAKDSLAHFKFENKVKWYLERDINTTTIEAKVKSRLGKLSIEFTNNGSFLDLERTIAASRLPKIIREKINKYFSTNYKRWGIRKVQEQYLGNLTGIKQELSNQIGNYSTVSNYEIVAKGKEKNKMKLYEFLFDENGNFLQRREIILKPTDNLQF